MRVFPQAELFSSQYLSSDKYRRGDFTPCACACACVCVREDEGAPTRDFPPVSALKKKEDKITFCWIFGGSFYDFGPTTALVMALKS